MKKLFFLISISCLLPFFSCSDSSVSIPKDIETSYCTTEQLALRESPYKLFSDASEWRLQYPSGTEKGGMLSWPVTQDFKSKYFSLFKAESGKEYIRFSLDASDKGKSANGSSVRSELRHMKEWNFTSTNSLSYTFYITSTDFGTARFTVGQFLQHCDSKDSPLCRIEIEDGTITAVVINYEKDGTTKADGTSHRYDLGTIKQKQEVSIKIEAVKTKLNLYRDNKLKATHIFDSKVQTEYNNYFKAGIYYQNKDSPKIFSEVFIRDLKTEIESD